MQARLFGAGLAALIAATPVLAQTSQQAPNKPETNCTPSAASGQTTGSTGQSTDIGKNAVLPSAGGHAQSAAPTVQNDGKPMQMRPDCPPDQTKSK